MTEKADDLLFAAAVFIDNDQGMPGFLDRFTEQVSGDARRVSDALHEALAARARAGKR